MPPYELLDAAVERAREQYPDMHDYKALWTPASDVEVKVEVWDTPHSAKVVRV